MADVGNGIPTDELQLLLIVYELAGQRNGDHRPNSDLTQALQDYPATTRLTGSSWVVRTPRSVTGVFDALDRHLAPDDRLFVGALTGEAAWRNIEDGYEWLSEAFDPGGPVQGRAV